MNYGVSLMAGQANTSGHELENGAATDKNQHPQKKQRLEVLYLSNSKVLTA